MRFSICACHPRAGAMLIFSVSFQEKNKYQQGQIAMDLALAVALALS